MPHRKPFAWSLLFGVCCALASLVQAMESPATAGAVPPVSQPSAVASAPIAIANAAPTVVTQAPPAETAVATAAAVPAAPEPAAPATAAAAAPPLVQVRSPGALPSSLDAATPPALEVSFAKAAALLDLMNGARLEAGVPALRPDGELEGIALVRADNLVENGYFDHYAPDGESAFSELAARGIAYRLAGENLARNNFAEAKTVSAAFEALMASPGHRANILEPRFNNVGVAAVLYGKVWLYVTVFKD